MSIALSGVLRTLLFEVSPADPFTLAATALILAVTGIVAIIIPARRALSVDLSSRFGWSSVDANRPCPG
jgi:hypothetical protein